MNDRPVYVPDSVKVVSKNKVSNTASISVGGVIIPFTHATVEFTVGEFVKLTIETRADLVDVEVLQSQTELVIRKAPSEDAVDPSAIPGSRNYTPDTHANIEPSSIPGARA